MVGKTVLEVGINKALVNRSVFVNSTCGKVGVVVDRKAGVSTTACAHVVRTLRIEPLLNIADCRLDFSVKSGLFFDLLNGVDSGRVVFTAKFTSYFGEA